MLKCIILGIYGLGYYHLGQIDGWENILSSSNLRLGKPRAAHPELFTPSIKIILKILN